MGMLIAAYAINLITTFSLSAIASNGTVRGGGAYYLISRSLGPEFGGSIGVVFYLGFTLNTGMNAVGLIDCIKLNFGSVSGNWSNVLPESQWYLYLWSTVVLVLCTAICLAGSSIFARASNGLLVILLLATLSIPFSALIVSPFESRKLGIDYTGLSLSTFLGNLKPQLTKGAAGSELKGKETFQDLFGILFPATGGIFAGASMSGDLKNPSKSIPKGTLYGLATTFLLYTLVILAMAATITRSSFVRNANVIQETNLSGLVILAGEFASSFFSTLMGVIGSAKLLQALARDNLLPGLSWLGQGTKKADEPTFAILVTWVVAQLTMLFDLNQVSVLFYLNSMVPRDPYPSLKLIYNHANLKLDCILRHNDIPRKLALPARLYTVEKLTNTDDIPRYEFSLLPSQHRLRPELPSVLPLLQLANCPSWYTCFRSSHVLCRWPLCHRLCWSPDLHLPHHPLHQSTEELG
jgi:potassium/chloride transporter 9